MVGGEGQGSSPAGVLPLRPEDPRELGPYQLVGRLGAGGMGEAFLSESGGRWVVVKAALPDASSEIIARMAREVEAMGVIDSPLFARVIAADMKASRPWFAMEFVPGPTLRQRIDQFGPIPATELVEFALQLAKCIWEMHRAGILHRDLKPENIVLSAEGPRLIDFGTADLAEATSLTVVGQVVGTVLWMAPEQVAGEPATPAVDVHAWGLLTLFAATGQPPFAADSLVSTMHHALHRVPDVPQSMGSPLAGLTARALAKNPVERPSIQEVLDSLEAGDPAQVATGPGMATVPRATLGAQVPAAPPPPALRGSNRSTQSSIPGSRSRWIPSRGVAAASVLAVLLLVPVGLNAAGAFGDGNDGPVLDPTEQATPAPSADTLTIWADETRAAPIQAECDKFAEENGFPCEVVQIQYGDIRAKVVQGNQTGDVPDLFIGGHDWLGELVTNGAVMPFDLGAKAADFSEVAVKAVAYDGTSYGVPYAMENLALLTNPELSPECPASLDDLVSQGEALLKDKKASLPLALQIGDEGDAYHWYPLYSANGGYIFGENADGTTNVDDMGVGKEGSIVAAESLQMMADKKLIKTTVTGDIAMESYSKGDSAWFITGPWNVEEAHVGIPDTMVCPVPNGPRNSAAFIGVQTMFIPTKAKNALASQTFLNDYVMTTEFMDAMYAADPRPPAWTASADKASADPIVKGFIDYGLQGIPQPSVPEMGSVWEPLGLAEFKVASGADPTKTMEQARDSIEEGIG